jgi:antitoxin MazE
MIKRLTRHGNSLALVIDKSVLDLLKIGRETQLEVSTDGDSLIVSPVRDESRDERFREALENTNRRYGRVLRKLAE